MTVILGIEPEPVAPPAAASEAVVDVALVPIPGLVEVLGADVALPALVRFVPDVRLRDAAAEAARYAMAVEVREAEGLQRADLALTTLRQAQRDIDEHFAEPVDIANKLHKRLTGIRSEWREHGEIAIRTIGTRIFAEQRRLEALAAEERRKVQEAADREAREVAAREAALAEAQCAPAAVVEQLRQDAATATAPPVPVAAAPVALKSSSVVTTWKARPKGTPGDQEPNPEIADMSAGQWARVEELLRAVLEGRAPRQAIAVNYSYLNSRAKADKGTFAIPGFEAFEQGSVRAKGGRR